MNKFIKTLLLIAFVVALIWLLFFLKTNSTENIPHEEPTIQKVLDHAISISKFSVDKGILELESLSNLPDYTTYKKDYILAKLYEKTSDYDKSITIYEKIVNKNYPLKERVLFHLAYLYALQNNDLKALKLYKKLINDFPNSRSVPQAKYFLAQAQLRLKLTKDATNTLLSLRREYPQTQFGIATNYYLGEYAYNLKNYQEALEYWREYLKLSPDGRFAEEIAHLLKANNYRYLLPKDYSLLADVFYHKKDYQNALLYYKIENNPKEYYKFGYSLFRTNNKPGAFSSLKLFAYKFPKSKYARWALYYAEQCIPYSERKSFWKDVARDTPELAHYAIYKRGLLETSSFQKESILNDLITNYPNSEFVLDAVWEIMWQKIKDKDYTSAKALGEKYFNLNNSSKSDTKAKIGFWLGKIAEVTGKKDEAIKYYSTVQNLFFDNYYSLRAKYRLLGLNGQMDPFWNQQNKTTDFINFNWSTPIIMRLDVLRKYFGACVSELVNLQQFDEAMDLIGKSKFPSRRVTVWLKALNSEYEDSINTATLISNEYNLNSNSQMWKLAYPLYFWQNVSNSCSICGALDPLLICGLIRQESRFESDACSISKACGLMQLIFPTAKKVAQEIGFNLSSLDLLNDPGVNIKLGVHYFNGLLGEFNSPLFAVASYNAGPQAVKSWTSQLNTRDLDFFVEEIPYNETKNYIKKVFSSYWTYIKLYKS